MSERRSGRDPFRALELKRLRFLSQGGFYS